MLFEMNQSTISTGPPIWDIIVFIFPTNPTCPFPEKVAFKLIINGELPRLENPVHNFLDQTI